MRKMNFPAGALLALWLAGAAMAAHAQGAIELKNTAEVERQIKTTDGKVEVRRAPAASAVPGTVVIYTTVFRNTGNKPAGGVVIKNPVPANTTLVPASAWGENTEISYSADGGKTWAAADKVKVKTADGKERPAGISEITDVRWSLRGDLGAGKQGEVGFRVVIN
jgi:uncharacterized repeat protein (TIGR01451 family)